MTNENKPGYKKTKLGWIPEEWEVKLLKGLAEIDSESLNSKTEKDYTFRYVSLSNVNNGFIDKELEVLEYENAPSRARRIVKKDDILMATVRPNLKAFGYVEEDENDLIASTGFAVIRTKYFFDSKYLFHFLFSNKMEAQLYSLVVGSNYPAINSSDVKHLKIPLPPLPEQKKIAQILSTWDKAIEQTQALLTQLQLRKKGLMQQLLTGKTRLKGFEGEWEEYSYDSILKQVSRKLIWDDDELYQLISVRRRSGGLFQRDSLYGREILTKNLKTAKSGDFLISKMQIVHGASGLTTDEFDNMKISGSYLALVAKNEDVLDIEFFSWLSKMPYFYHQTYISSYGVHIEKMTFNFKIFLKLKTNLPSIAEQKAIVKILKEADAEILQAEKYLASLQTQKKGLMQQLLTGQKRVELN